MGLLDRIIKPKPARVRKQYDRLREKVDRLPRIEKRVELLKMMDQIEQQVISMEEHPMSGFEQRKTAEYIRFSLRRIDFLMKEEKRKAKDFRR